MSTLRAPETLSSSHRVRARRAGVLRPVVVDARMLARLWRRFTADASRATASAQLHLRAGRTGPAADAAAYAVELWRLADHARRMALQMGGYAALAYPDARAQQQADRAERMARNGGRS